MTVVVVCHSIELNEYLFDLIIKNKQHVGYDSEILEVLAIALMAHCHREGRNRGSSSEETFCQKGS